MQCPNVCFESISQRSKKGLKYHFWPKNGPIGQKKESDESTEANFCQGKFVSSKYLDVSAKIRKLSLIT